ncbi:MAG: hypothetical protein WDO15_06140 [Bacteroidota bacterium]
MIKLRLLVLVCFACTQCTMYRTFDVPANETSFKYYAIKSPIWTLQKGGDSARYIIVNKIEADAITVTPGSVQTINDHKPNADGYWRHWGRYHLGHFHITVQQATDVNVKSRIPFTDIQKAQTHRIDAGPTIISSFLTGAGYTLVGGGVFLLIACNCPLVSVVGKEGLTNEGLLFPGAMGKALSRNDNLLLRHAPLVDNRVQIRVSNKLPETEYIDQVELFELSNVAFTNVALTSNGKPISYETGGQPTFATSGIGTDVLNKISEADDARYSFDEFESDDELNKVYLKFQNPGEMKPVLVINARQDPWIETVGEFFFQQFGTAFPKWVDRLDKTNPDRYNQSLRDRGISMNIYQKAGAEWKRIGSFENAGSIAGRELALPIDLEGNAGAVEIKLEAAHGLWEIDRVSLSTKWNDDIQLNKLRTLSATNNEQRDVLPLVSSADGQYLLQPRETSFVDITFEAPQSQSPVLMLSGTGYYHHLRNYTTKPNFRYLKEFNRENLSTHRLSRLMKTVQASSASNTPKK